MPDAEQLVWPFSKTELVFKFMRKYRLTSDIPRSDPSQQLASMGEHALL